MVNICFSSVNIQSIFPYFHSREALKNHFLRLKFQELLLHLLELEPSQQLRSILLWTI
ncbi:hypothetical protein [Dyadobacter jejuensis]|uniref:hypothetical protein n=1 Tax=Dyadobacter jejuensis TaxID=1082580 RepID=UPI0035B5C849